MSTGLRFRLRLVRGDAAPGLEGDAGLRAAWAAHGGELYGFALRALDDPGLAEEAVAETFVRAWRAARRFDPELGSLRAWLFAILRNVVVDSARSRVARPPLVDTGALEARAPASVGDELDDCLRSWQVEEALRELSPEHRRVIIEIYYDGRTAPEVAARLGVPEGTVRSRLFYGLKALRLALEERGWDG